MASVALALTALVSCSSKDEGFRLLFWNIQNGMWSEQGNDYEGFVNWVSEQNPDICVWCEAQSIYTTGTADAMDKSERYLVENWGELAGRYGHSYWYIGGYRDDYPQVITSRYPIENVSQIIGEEPDSVVTHGAGWARIKIGRETVNLVSLHLWPQRWGFRTQDKEAGKASNEGDRYRRMEIEYIIRHTVGTSEKAAEENWIMMGDFNSKTRLDNYHYGFPEDTTAFLVQDYILENTPYRDIIAEKYPEEFKTTTGRMNRIDYVYCTSPLFERIEWCDVITDSYTKPVRDPQKLSNFWHPSDHRPIIVDFR